MKPINCSVNYALRFFKTGTFYFETKNGFTAWHEYLGENGLCRDIILFVREAMFEDLITRWELLRNFHSELEENKK